MAGHYAQFAAVHPARRFLKAESGRPIRESTAEEDLVTMPTIWTGQPVPHRGWFIDQHGHRLLLRRGDLAPICPFLGPAGTAWRLAVPIPEPLPPST